METRSVEATTIRIFERDHLPFWDLLSRDVVDGVTEAFRFEDVDTGQDADDPALTFSRGGLDPNDSDRRRAVRSLTIDDRRIEVVVSDPDGHAAVGRFLRNFAAVAGELTGGPAGWLDRFQTETANTVWVGQLKIDPLHLLDPRVRAAAQRVRRDCKTPQYDPLLSLKGLSFRLTFNITDPKLLESSVYFRDREFRLEPRFGVPAEERAWFSSSPLPSDQHLALLEQIETEYAQK